jgi:hypothetical protein
MMPASNKQVFRASRKSLPFSLQKSGVDWTQKVLCLHSAAQPLLARYYIKEPDEFWGKAPAALSTIYRTWISRATTTYF